MEATMRKNEPADIRRNIARQFAAKSEYTVGDLVRLTGHCHQSITANLKVMKGMGLVNVEIVDKHVPSIWKRAEGEKA